MHHTPLPPADVRRATILQGITERLAELHEAERTPLAIVMGPDIARFFQQREVLNLPVELDATGKGWEIRTKL